MGSNPTAPVEKAWKQALFGNLEECFFFSFLEIFPPFSHEIFFGALMEKNGYTIKMNINTKANIKIKYYDK